jgi:drug/metabolite transporter superfamily protein YnfA
MPPENRPPPATRQRQHVMLSLTVVMLVVCALFALFALKKLPVPVRAFIAFGDIAMALTILLLMRKNPLRPR